MAKTFPEIDRWLKEARAAGLISDQGWEDESRLPAAPGLVFPSSVRRQAGLLFALLPVKGARLLGIFGPPAALAALEAFRGEERSLAKAAENKAAARFCPLSHENAQALRRTFPFTAPSSLAGEKATVGVGDRLGEAGPGHVRTFKAAAAAPVLAQQSVRELTLTGRSYEEVLDSSTWAVFQEGFQRPWGADGDHLKTEEWVRTALGIGYTMITADVSDYIRGEYLLKSDEEVRAAYLRLDEAYRRRVEKSYLSLRLELDTAEAVVFSEDELLRLVLVYREGIEHASRLYRAAVAERGEGGFDFELSVDETANPTTPQAHLFAAREAMEAGVRISSLAPRFVGEFQKGIDYIGNISAFEHSFRTHAAIARALGYRISVHSGSDKFSVFPAIGRLTRGCFHLKTAGTNWLEAVKVIARHEPALYRRLHAKALATFAKATSYYHVTTDLGKVPPLKAVKDQDLAGYFDNPDARQLIHITYGEILSDPKLKADFFLALEKHREAYWQAIQDHIGRHLSLLGLKG